MIVAPRPASANWPEKNEPTTLGSWPAARSFTLPPVMIGMEAGIDDELNRLVAEFANRRDHFVRELAGARIHHQRP